MINWEFQSVHCDACMKMQVRGMTAQEADFANINKFYSSN